MGRSRKQAPRMRLSRAKRELFLEVLGQTGNRSAAAAAIGVEPRLMDQRRRFDPELDRAWRAAVAQSERRLAGATGPLDCIGGAEAMVIRRGPGGRLRIVKAGPRRWSRPVEECFFAALANTGNIAAAARSVGFSPSCIAQRRRKWPEFAERMEEVLEDAEIALEFRMAVESGGWANAIADGAGAGVGDVTGDAPQPAPFDPDLAMRFLKWRQEKRKGGGARGRVPAPASVEEAAANIIRKVEAIKRHRAREAARRSVEDGDAGDGP